MAVPVTVITQGTPHLAAACGTSEGSGQRRCETLSFGGVERNYRLYVPAKLRKSAPVLVVLHGYFQDAAGMEATTGKGIYRLADEAGALLIYPNSVGTHWNAVPATEQPSEDSDKRDVDDVGFLRALVASIGQRYAIDPERVFVAGFSNGGQMALRLACEAPDVYRGFVAVAITMREALAANCHPSVARRVALFKGTASGYARGGRFIGAEGTLAKFSAIAGCGSVNVEPWRPNGTSNPTNVVVHRAIGCPDDLGFVLYEIKDGLHVWPGGMPDAPTLATRVKSQQQPEEQLDANIEIWHFLGLDDSRDESRVSQTSGAMH
jgi:poly(3-hydroxybutyrate) depolymerase